MKSLVFILILLTQLNANAAQHVDIGLGFNFPMGVEKISDNADTSLASHIGWRNDASDFLSLGLGLYNLEFKDSTLSDRALYATGRYTLNNQGFVLIPHLSAGVGVSQTRSHSKSQSLSTAFIGGGAKNQINERLSLILDVNYHLIGAENTKPSEQHLLVALIGLSYRFGDMVQSAPVQEVVQEYDTDQDGVLDSSDQCPNTPYGTSVNYLGCEKNTEIKRVFDIKFELETARLQKQYDHDLKKIAMLLLTHPTLTIEVHGHTDTTGDKPYNLSLSQRRAESVTEYLIVNHNIAANRVFPKGFGSSRPLVSNDTREKRQLNRRVEVKFITQ